MAHAVYVSGLPFGFKSLCVNVAKSNVTNAVMHDAKSFFFICKDEQTVESILNQFHGNLCIMGVGSWVNSFLN